MSTRILRTTWLLLLCLNVGIAGASNGESLSKIIVGRWQNVDAQPPRYLKLLSDGTWQLVYSGRSDVQTGKWEIDRRTLTRTYDNGEVRRSEIVKLNHSQMLLSIRVTDNSSGRSWNQIDHYNRLNDTAATTPAADGLKRYEVWITGEVLVGEQNQLLFRADKPVQGNNTGNLVVLGATKQTMNVLLPMYMKAADKHMRLRLFGFLEPDPTITDPKLPNVQFITWKVHMPNEPDELPADQKVEIGPKDKVPGYTIEGAKKP